VTSGASCVVCAAAKTAKNIVRNNVVFITTSCLKDAGFASPRNVEFC
jgi:hypothetical protein